MILKMLSAQANCIGAPSAERENKTTQNIKRNLQVRLSANKHSLFSTNQQEVIREYKENSCDCGRSTIQLLPTLVGSRMAWYSWICAVTCIHACQSHALALTTDMNEENLSDYESGNLTLIMWGRP